MQRLVWMLLIVLALAASLEAQACRSGVKMHHALRINTFHELDEFAAAEGYAAAKPHFEALYETNLSCIVRVNLLRFEALALMREGENWAAIEKLEQALGLAGPAHSQSQIMYLVLGRLYGMEVVPDKGLDYAERFVEHSTHTWPGQYIELMYIYATAGELQKAEAVISTVRETLGDIRPADIWRQNILLLLELGRVEEARALVAERFPERLDLDSSLWGGGDWGYEIVKEFEEAQTVEDPVPDYPRLALKGRIEGDCEVHFSVTPDGKPENIVPLCTHHFFISEARRAVKRTRFSPRLLNGTPVKIEHVVYPLAFRVTR